MRNTPLYVLLLLLGWATVGSAQAPAADEAAAASVPVASSNATAAPASDQQGELVNQLLNLLGDTIVTRLDARVSLESLEVESGRIRLNGVSLKNLNVGLKLNAKASQRLAQILQQRYAQKAGSSGQQWVQFLEILKLGLFNNLEISVHLDELSVRRLSIDTDDLQIAGALLQVGVNPPDPATGKPRNDTLQMLMYVLRQTALDRIKAEAGLDKLSARRARLDLDGILLKGFSLGVLLARQEQDSPQTTE